MSAATLTIRKVDSAEHETRHVRLSCPHGDTDGIYSNAPGGLQLSDDAVARFVLLRHLGAERCRCTRKLWREYFGAPWPEAPLPVLSIVGAN